MYDSPWYSDHSPIGMSRRCNAPMKQHTVYKLLDSTKRCKWDVGGKSVFFTSINSHEVTSVIDRIINDCFFQFSHRKADRTLS